MNAGAATADAPARRRRPWIAGALFGGAAVGMLAGWALLIDASRKLPVKEATLDGIRVEMLDARWVLDQMDHGDNFQKPASMMPDMPEWGSQRVSLALALENVNDQPRTFRGEEFTLEPEIGEVVPPIGAQVGRAVLLPGQRLNTAIHFDLDTRLPHGKIRAAWRHEGEVVYLPIPEPAEHTHLKPRADAGSLPPDARLLLPLGKPERGKELYDLVYGCVACHGSPATPGSNNVGPHLADIGRHAANRIDGMSAAQYIYQSILAPNAFIAPSCRDDLPCERPSAMPEYESLVSLEDVAHLVTFLLGERGG